MNNTGILLAVLLATFRLACTREEARRLLRPRKRAGTAAGIRGALRKEPVLWNPRAIRMQRMEEREGSFPAILSLTATLGIPEKE